MTTSKPNPGEGVPKETPARHSLDTLAATLSPVLSTAGAAALVTQLRADGYFDRSLMQQFEAAAQAVAAVCTSASQRNAALAALKASPSDRMRGYAAAVALIFYRDTPERCLRELYAVGILPGTWAQESAQTAVKRLMQHHGVAPLLPLCEHWVRDDIPEARRLLVEALRPRGVWTGYINDLRRDPTPLKPILETVLDDPSDYVRKAVANCINDISKDHPDLLCRWVKKWHSKRMSPERAWILKRGLRTLTKAGHPGALALMGFDASTLFVTWNGRMPARIQPGEAIPVNIALRNTGPTPAGVHVQMILEGPGRGNAPRRTIYQIAQLKISPNVETVIEKRIPFRHRNSQPKIPGTYRVTLQVNGQNHETRQFQYTEP